jgi:hypothetical protein
VKEKFRDYYQKAVEKIIPVKKRALRIGMVD